MIWEPFILALVLGIIVSAGLYFAYLWPSVEPVEAGEGEPVDMTTSPVAAGEHEPVDVTASPVAEPQPPVDAGAGLTEETRAAAETAVAVADGATAAEEAPDVAAGNDAAAGPAASPAP